MTYSDESAPTPKYTAQGLFNFINPVTGIPSTVTLNIEVSAYDQYGSPTAGELADGMFQLFIDHLFAMPSIPGVEETGRTIQGTKTNLRSQDVTPSA